MLGVISLGVLKGVLIAIVAAGVYLLARVSRPSDALLGLHPRARRLLQAASRTACQTGSRSCRLSRAEQLGLFQYRLCERSDQVDCRSPSAVDTVVHYRCGGGYDDR